MDKRPIADPELEAYAAAHSSPEPPWLTAAALSTQADTSDPGMMVGHLEGRLLAAVVAMLQPRLVVEIGTFTGYSAMCMAENLPPGGRIITDRKSTRLNSSHANISYAVFCLKKK